MKINFASIGNSALVISGSISAYLLSVGKSEISAVVILVGIVAKAVCSEINNQQTDQTTPAPKVT
jgi:hypothetical protein